MNKNFKISLLITGLICLTVFVSLFSLLKYLQSDHALKKAESLFSQHIKGKISFEKISINLWKPGITFYNVEIKSNSENAVAGCEKLQIHLTLSHLFSDPIQIENFSMIRPWLYLPISYKKPFNFKRFLPFLSLIDCLTRRQLFSPVKTKDSSALIVDAIKLKDGTIYFTKNDKKIKWSIENINIDSNEDKLNLSGNLTYLRLNNNPLEVLQLKAKGSYSNNKISQKLIRTFTSKSPKVFHERLKKIMMYMSFQSQGKISLVNELFKQNEFLKNEISGDINGSFQINAKSSIPVLKMSLNYSGGQIHGIPLKSFMFNAIAADQIVTLNPINIEVESGKVDIKGLIDFRKFISEGFFKQKKNWDKISYQFFIDSNNFPLKKIYTKIPQESLLNGKIIIKGNGFDRETLYSDITFDTQVKLPKKLQISSSDSNLKIKAKAIIESNSLTLNYLSAKTEALSLTGLGNIELDSNKDANLIVNIESSCKLLEKLNIPSLTGNIHSILKINKSKSEVKTNINLNGKKLSYKNYFLGNLVADADISSNGKIIINNAVLSQFSSKIETKGFFHLNKISKWIFKPENYQFIINSNDIALHLIHPELSGIVNIEGIITGNNLIEPEGDLKIKASALSLFGQKLSSMNIPINISNQEVCLDSGEINIFKNEKVFIDACVNRESQYSFIINSKSIKLSNIKWTIPETDGQIQINLTGKGSTANPQLSGEIKASKLIFRNQPLSDAFIKVASEKDYLSINGKSLLNFNGKYYFKKQEFQINANAKKMKLMPILTHLGFSELDGSFSGRLNLNGHLDNIKNAKAQVNIDEIAITFQDRPLVWMNNFNFFINNQILTESDYMINFPQNGYLKGSISGVLPYKSCLRIKSNIPLELLSIINDNISDIQGNIVLKGEVQNFFYDPIFEGYARIEDASFVLPWNQQRCHQLKGYFSASKHIFTLNNFSFRLDNGKCEMQGKMTLSKRNPTHIDLLASFSALPVHFTDSFDLLLNANLKYSKKYKKSSLKGSVEFLEGLYYKEFNVNKMILQRLQNSKKASFIKRICKNFPEICQTILDINIKSRQPLIADNDTAYFEIEPDLNVRGSLFNPVVLGRAEMFNGEINYLSKNFVLEKGLIDFINPYRTDPIIDIKSNVEVRDWKINLDVLGKINELQVKLNSTPPEEHGDIISILLFGKTTDQLFENDKGSYKSTQQMIAELLSNAFEKDIKNTTGLDTFKLEALEHEDIEDNQTDDYKVTLGKELSRRMSITYAFETQKGQLIHHTIANYKILENLILRGMQDTQGIYGGELLFRMEFRQIPGFNY